MVYSNYKVPTTVLKIGVAIGERFSRCLLSSQKLLYKTACSPTFVFLKTEQKYLTIFIVSFWCSVIISAFRFLIRVVKQPYLKPKASCIKTKVIGHFVCKNHQFKQRTNEAKTKESKCNRSVRVRTVSYWTWN